MVSEQAKVVGLTTGAQTKCHRTQSHWD